MSFLQTSSGSEYLQECYGTLFPSPVHHRDILTETYSFPVMQYTFKIYSYHRTTIVFSSVRVQSPHLLLSIIIKNMTVITQESSDSFFFLPISTLHSDPCEAHKHFSRKKLQKAPRGQSHIFPIRAPFLTAHCSPTSH